MDDRNLGPSLCLGVLRQLCGRQFAVAQGTEEERIALLKPGGRRTRADKWRLGRLDDRPGHLDVAAMNRADDRVDMVDLHQLRGGTECLFRRGAVVVLDQAQLTTEKPATGVDLVDRDLGAVT